MLKMTHANVVHSLLDVVVGNDLVRLEKVRF